MRKIVSVVLCVLFLLSLSCFGVSAATPEGTAISTAAEFAAMEADKAYYLTNDIVITESYANPFTGKFDGNGHTVTITAPLFKEFNGIVTNLTIDGNEITAADDLGALAVYTKGMTAVNLINNVDLKVTGINEADTTKGLNAGGFIGDAEGSITSTCIFRNCVNNGDVTVETAVVKDEVKGTNYETHAGGLIGRADGINAMFCVNNGAITASCKNGQAGGMTARAAFTSDYVYVDFSDCTNNGAVFGGLDAAGFVAYLGLKGNDIYLPYTFYYCSNTADITGGYRVGGFLGYCYAGSTQNFDISYCVSTGNINAGRVNADLAGGVQYTYAGLLVGYSNSANNKIFCTLAQGKLTALTGENFCAPFFCVLGCSSAQTLNMKLENFFMCDYDTTYWYSYASSDENAAQRIEIAKGISNGLVTRCTQDEVSNGTMLGKLNAAAGAEVFVQSVGTQTAPVLNSALADVRKAEDTVNTAFETTTEKPTETEAPTDAPTESITDAPTDSATNAPTDSVTEAPTAAPTEAQKTTTEAPKTTEATKPQGGCGSVSIAAYGFVAIAAILGSAVVIKKH